MNAYTDIVMNKNAFGITVAVLLTMMVVSLGVIGSHSPAAVAERARLAELAKSNPPKAPAVRAEAQAKKTESATFAAQFTLGIIMSIYFLPAIIAGFRNHHNTGAILVLNFFLGWTGLGWIASLVWSATSVPAVARG